MNLARWVPLVALLLAGACATPSTDTKTINWEPSGGSLRFFTNEKKYYNYMFYRYLQNDTPGAKFSGMTATLKKVSGADTKAYGIMFCFEDQSNYYEVVITTNRAYSIWKQENAEWLQIVGWTGPGNLNSGIGQPNEISVTRDESGEFAVSFNGTYETSFSSDGDDVVLDADRFGVMAYVGDASVENFPKIGVDVRATITEPTLYPSVQGSVRSTKGAYSSGSGWSKGSGSDPRL